MKSPHDLAADRTEALAWIAGDLQVESGADLLQAVIAVAAAYDADQSTPPTSFTGARDKLKAMSQTIDAFLVDMAGFFPKRKGGLDTTSTEHGFRGFGQATQEIGRPPRALTEAEEWRQITPQWEIAQSALKEISQAVARLPFKWNQQPGRGISTVENYAINPPHWRLADRCYFDLWRRFRPDVAPSAGKLIDLCGRVFIFSAAYGKEHSLLDVEGHIRKLLAEKPA
jgi:hypothetical protein